LPPTPPRPSQFAPSPSIRSRILSQTTPQTNSIFDKIDQRPLRARRG
jgi:hypothetical protein